MTNSKSIPWNPGLVNEHSQPKEGRPGIGPGTRPTRWSWRLGAIAGIPVYVHATFALLLAWVALSPVVRGNGVRAMSSGLLLILSIFACVVLHELSHALMARRFGIRTRDITLLPIGGVASLEKMPEKPSQELLVAVAGPAMSLAVALVLFGLLALLKGPTGLEGLNLVGGPFLTKLMWINLLLAGFNLLPAFPMDGGRVLRAALALRMDRGRATEVAARIGQGMALLFGALGLFHNPFLVIIAVFVWMGAKGEVSLVQLKSALSGMTVSQAMITDFRALAPRDSLARAVELTLAGFQQSFPVMDGSRLAGVLTHANVLKGLADRGRDEVVEAVMERQFETAEPADLLEGAFGRLQGCACRALVVTRDGRVVGLLTPENIGEMLTMESALRRSHTRGALARGA
jgi:Zn-dependent protease/predicted transcriptional regulator